MTCKDCIHEDICDMPIITDGRKNASNCKKFKNKANFVEVVYCKDCEWSTERTRNNELFQYQCRNTIACGKPRRAIDFCSYGERKTDNDL